MAKLNIKTGDNVLVIAGKDKGKVAKVLSTSPKSNKVVVEGVNIATKHQKAKKQDEKSKIVKIEAPIDASNVMVVCPHCNKATRVGYKEVDGKKIRVCKHTGENLDVAKAKTAKKAAKEETKVAKATEGEAKVAKTTTAKKPAAPKTAKKETAVKTAAPKTTTKVTTRKTAPSSGK